MGLLWSGSSLPFLFDFGVFGGFGSFLSGAGVVGPDPLHCWMMLTILIYKMMRTSPSAKGVDAKLCQVDDPPLVEGQLSALERLRRINSDPRHQIRPEKIEPSRVAKSDLNSTEAYFATKN